MHCGKRQTFFSWNHVALSPRVDSGKRKPDSRCRGQALSPRRELVRSISTDRRVAASFPSIKLAFLELMSKIPHTTTSLFAGLVTWLCGLKCQIFLLHVFLLTLGPHADGNTPNPLSMCCYISNQASIHIKFTANQPKM